MHQGWLLIGLSLAYLGLLFLIAYVADKNKRRRPNGQPLLYSLSLAVYCTSWTFFGSVGLAAERNFEFLAIYVGPILVFLFGYPLLIRIVRLAKTEKITSIADFLGAAVIGGPDTVRDGLARLLSATGADELMLVCDIFDPALRLRSLDLAVSARDALGRGTSA